MRVQRVLILATALWPAFAAAAFGATIPVGASTGSAFYFPADLDPADGCPCGESVEVTRAAGQVGTWTMSGGQTFSIGGAPGTTGENASAYVAAGNGDSANGTITLTGAGTKFTVLGNNNGATVHVGVHGATGAFNVDNGADFSVYDPNSSTANNDDAIHLGEAQGTGTLSVNGGTVSVQTGSGASLYVGANNGTGSGPNDGATGIANFANNSSLVLRDLTNSSTDENDAAFVIGQGDYTSGTVTVDHSSVAVDGQDSSAFLNIGEHINTTADMTVKNGSTVSVTANSANTAKGVAADAEADLVVGGQSGSHGTLNVDGGSTINMSGPFVFVGLGDHDNSTGTMTLSGGSTLSTGSASESDLEIAKGVGSKGTVNVTDGSTISMNAPFVYVGIGDQQTGASGEMNMSGGSTFSDGGVNGDVQIGQWNPSAANGGAGKLSVSGAGTKFDVSGTMEIGTGAGVGSSSGTLRVDSGGEVTAREVSLYRGGLLMGNGGTINADVNLNAGGVIAPGASPGTMTINGDLNANAGVLQVQIAGTDPADYDHLIVDGDLNATTTPLSIHVTFLSFLPQIGDTFDFLQVLGLVNAPGDPFDVSIAGFKSSDFDIISSGGIFSFKTVALATTPIPGTLPLLASALGGLGFAGWRRKASRVTPIRSAP